ncbi:MAG: hypothetical protein IJ242_06870 [Clostridia bacterium]|nr:hypothetical protein [Clostridia bacterium]
MRFKRILTSTVIILIPCILGILGMISGGIQTGIWVQNPIFILSCAIAAFAVGRFGIRIKATAVVMASILLIGATWLGPDISGVHRWLRVPGISFNAAAVVLPACIVALTQLADEQRTGWFSCGTAIIAMLLCMQPDASQLLAFALPMTVLLICSQLNRILKWSGAGILTILTVLSWLRGDTLAPVSYTEGILTLLRDQSVLLYIAGILALCVVPAFLIIQGIREERKVWTFLGLYYALMILSTFFGSFPVPFMGYGASPILGYFMMPMASTSLIITNKY